MSILLLTEAEVQSLLTMEVALEAVEQVLREQALDEAQIVPRSRCQTDHAMLHLLAGAAKGVGALGYKAYCTTRKGAHFHVGLFDGKSGELKCLLQADYLGQVRTGAASGVATRLLARAESKSVGLFGTGKQARTQLLAVCKVRSVERVQVYSPNEERRRLFCHEMAKAVGIDVQPVEHPQLAGRGKDIVITATSSREPVLLGEWLAEGTHLNVIGSNYLSKAEIDVAAVRRSKVIAVDSKDQARLEAGDFVKALEEGSLQWPQVHELGQVIVGRHPGRSAAGDITLFKSLGIGLEDVAVAARVYENAVATGVGRMVDW